MKNSYAPRWLLFSKKFTVCSPKNSGQWPSFFLFIKSLKICIKNGGDIALNSKTPAKTYKDRFCCYSHFELTFQRDNNDEESDFFLNINSLQYFCPFFQAWVSSSLVKKNASLAFKVTRGKNASNWQQALQFQSCLCLSSGQNLWECAAACLLCL